MPRTPASVDENLPLHHEEEREQPPATQEGHHQHRRWFAILQVLSIIVAMTLALYNHALLGSLPNEDTTPQAWLTESEPMEPVEPCNQGGIRLYTGLDSNINGVLDAEERSDPLVVCHGPRGLSGPQGQPGTNGSVAHTQLMATEVLLPGNATCPEGGTQFRSGLDLDGNGSLDPNEVVDESLLCNGLLGENGVDGGDGDAGFSALVDKTVAPAYVCLDGFQLRFGIDDGAGGALSNNGILEPSEVRETLNLCFEPLRSERITDIYDNVGNSMTIGCEASAWLPSSHRFLFAASDGVHGCELHVSDGTVNNTELLADLHPNGDALPGRDLGFHVLDQRVVFFDATDGTNGRQLWVSDGSANGTFALGMVEMEPPVPWNNGFVFSSTTGDLLWTNGTDLRPWLEHPAWNTSQQATVQSSMAGLQQPGSAWLHGDQHAIWFSAEDTLGDIEPHRLTNDGTLTSWEVNAFGDTQLFHPLSDENDLVAVAVRAGVKQLIRLEDDGSASWLTSIAPASGDTRLGEGMGVHRIGDNLLYDAVTNNNEPRLWTTNMANGISLQLDEEILAPGAQVGVANTGERLFFDCVTPSSGTEMCVTDGTPGGSNVFHDLTPGVLSSDIRGLVAVGDGAAMVSDGVTSGDAVGVSLWMIEGDELHMAYNPWPGTGNSSQALTYGSMTLTDSQVFFVAHDGEFGHEWHRWSHGELSDDWIVIDR